MSQSAGSWSIASVTGVKAAGQVATDAGCAAGHRAAAASRSARRTGRGAIGYSCAAASWARAPASML